MNQIHVNDSEPSFIFCRLLPSNGSWMDTKGFLIGLVCDVLVFDWLINIRRV